MKWKPEEEKLTDFVFRFSQLAHELSIQMINKYHTLYCAFLEDCTCTYKGAKTVPDAVENLRKGIALGGLDTFNSVSTTVDDRKPVVPFWQSKNIENR